MTAITSIRLPKPVSADLTIKSDLALTNPIGKHGLGGGGGGGCEAGRCNKHLTHKVYLL